MNNIDLGGVLNLAAEDTLNIRLLTSIWVQKDIAPPIWLGIFGTFSLKGVCGRQTSVAGVSASILEPKMEKGLRTVWGVKPELKGWFGRLRQN